MNSSKSYSNLPLQLPKRQSQKQSHASHDPSARAVTYGIANEFPKPIIRLNSLIQIRRVRGYAKYAEPWTGITHKTNNPMQSNLSAVVRLAACLALAFTLTANADDKKADPTGTWKWSMTGQNGQTRESTLTLKLDGDKLTGSLAGRNGDTAISKATLKGDEIAFEVTREINGNSMTSKYSGKLSGDTIKGKIETTRDGEARSRDWDAKREAAKPKDEAKPKEGAAK
jgi:hypothetical protein